VVIYCIDIYRSNKMSHAIVLHVNPLRGWSRYDEELICFVLFQTYKSLDVIFHVEHTKFSSDNTYNHLLNVFIHFPNFKMSEILGHRFIHIY
jgi:hypothetical protein